MANTTNFGWETPDDTDLVKDGAAAMRTLGNSIDASFVDLKGGTTGQVLAKASNADLDFVWSADASGIPATIFDAKGDLIAASAADTAARLAVGTNGQVLTADSTAATGLKWASPSVSGNDWTLLNVGGTSLTGAGTVTVSGISGKNSIMILVSQASSSTASATIAVRLNGDTASNYYRYGLAVSAASTYSTSQVNRVAGVTSYIDLGYQSSDAASDLGGYCLITGCNTSNAKVFTAAGGITRASGSGQGGYVIGGYYNSSSTISSISIYTDGASLDGGSVFVYVSNT